MIDGTDIMRLATNMFRTAVLLTLFAIVCTALVAYTYDQTRDRIAESERKALLVKLHSVVAPDMYNNELIKDITTVISKKYLGTDQPVTVFRARKDGKPSAVILTPIAPNGYNGPIKLIIGIKVDGTLSGVRVLEHNETPGLGDAIEERRSPWIHVFDNRSLQNPGKKGWHVKRDGGDFDQFTGATITPRAVVKAVHNALLFFANNKERLFADKAPTDKPETQGREKRLPRRTQSSQMINLSFSVPYMKSIPG